MGSGALASIVLLLSLRILFLASLSSAEYCPPSPNSNSPPPPPPKAKSPPPPPHKVKSPPPPPPKVKSPPPPPMVKSSPPPPIVKSSPPPPPPPPKAKSPPPPPMVKSPPPMVKSPPPPPPPPSLPQGTCPRDTLKLQACANVLNLLKIFVGEKEKAKCCSLIDGLVDLEAAVCLCTRIKVDLLGLIKIDVPVAVELLLNECDRKVAEDFKCPPY
ncbi:LIPID TRANSFER PROTEIN [Salix purpurea]|uniref:LIPID TRANSFER PROTEIN n=1 Tax=Salix purpurea TaxID=77065 RepID=A0A9Q0TIH5_SALPP|nr:LIPID TRANSFER PROTEIN [Salix purpurea]